MVVCSNPDPGGSSKQNNGAKSFGSQWAWFILLFHVPIFLGGGYFKSKMLTICKHLHKVFTKYHVESENDLVFRLNPVISKLKFMAKKSEALGPKCYGRF